VEPVALAYDLRKQPQLADGAPAFAFESRARQAGLGHRALDQLVSDREDRLGAGLEEGGAARGIRARVSRKRRGRERRRLLDRIGTGRGEARFERFARRRVHGGETLVALQVLEPDEDGAIDHDKSFQNNSDIIGSRQLRCNRRAAWPEFVAGGRGCRPRWPRSVWLRYSPPPPRRRARRDSTGSSTAAPMASRSRRTSTATRCSPGSTPTRARSALATTSIW